MLLEQTKALGIYSKQLETQNIAKLNQINNLKKQIDLLKLSSNIQSLNNQSQCKQCIRKQQQIDTLIKALKSLRNQKKTEQKLINQQSKHQITVEEQNQHSQILKQNDHYLLFLNNSRKSIQRQPKQYSTQINLSIIVQKLKQQNYIYLKRITQLQQKLHKLENKIFILQQTNQIIKQDIIKHNKLKSNQSTIQHKFNAILTPSSNEDKRRVPVFSSFRNNMTRNIVQAQHLQTIQSRSHVLQSTSVISGKLKNYELFNQNRQIVSPLQVFTNKNQNTPRRFQIRQDNLIEQRKRSLSYKIKILQNQNRRLRTQIFE